MQPSGKVQSESREISAVIDNRFQHEPQTLQEMPLADSAPERLSLIGLPSLPGQQLMGARSTGVIDTSSRPGAKNLRRADLGKIRGVDPSLAPQDLRCAIDGRVLGTPVRSPYGHLFELDTLEKWIGMCGSVCPVTGHPLRLEECVADHACERSVLEWAKASKTEHRQRQQERKLQRQMARAEQAACASPDGEDQY